MIQRLRRAHRSAFLGLALFLPALLASAFRVRREPLTQALPPELLPALATARVPHTRLGTDELVYWIDGPVEDFGELPAGAEFVGSVRSGALALAPPAGKQIITYSLSHRRVNPTEKDL